MKRRFLPSFTALQAFEAAARHGNFTRAAEELSLTQGAISRQIKGLEDALGIVLFDRVRQRVVLTELGSAYVDDVRRTLDSLERSSARAMEISRGSKILEIATLPTFCSRWLIPRLGSFHAQHPRVTINFTSRFVRFDLKEENFDLAIHFGPPSWPGATLHELFAEHMVACASPAFLTRHPIASDEDVLNAPLLQQTTRPEAWPEWFAAIGRLSPLARNGARYDQFSMIARAASAGLGIALLPELLIEEELRSGRLVAVSPRTLQYDSNYHLVVPDAKVGNQDVLHFRDWLLSRAEEFRAGRAVD